MRFDLATIPAGASRKNRKNMTVPRLARALAFLLAVMPLPALAAAMPAFGTKNFTPSPATPSYFSGGRGVSDVGRQSPAAPAAAPSVAVTPPRPAGAAAPAYRSANRRAHARSFRRRTIKVRAVRSVRRHRLRAVRSPHARARHKPAVRR
jgi:hypothetical protein